MSDEDMRARMALSRILRANDALANAALNSHYAVLWTAEYDDAIRAGHEALKATPTDTPEVV